MLFFTFEKNGEATLTYCPYRALRKCQYHVKCDSLEFRVLRVDPTNRADGISPGRAPYRVAARAPEAALSVAGPPSAASVSSQLRNAATFGRSAVASGATT